jgi:crotonobetainyl-CoA:carnitine CoA-transferase CaiB-like acyl-CoA transferase
MQDDRLPLDGIKVLDLGRLVAAPFATQLMGDFGANIIKIERPGRGDEYRHYGPPYLTDADGKPNPAGPEAPGYLAMNRNKRSVTVDFQQPKGQEIIRELAKTCDVFVENYKVGTLKKYGLDYESLSAINPDIIYLSITGFGQTGPYADRPGTDIIFQSMSGMMSVTGDPNGPPVRSGILIADMVTGFYAANAVMLALREREVLGKGGQHIDLALMDCAVSAMTGKAMEYFMTGKAPFRSGNRVKGSVPAQIFKCKDGDLNVQASSEPDFRRLCDILGLPELKEDPRFSTRGARSQNADELEPILAERFANRTVGELYETLVDADVIAAPIYTLDQTFADPQVRHRGLKTTVPHPYVGELTVLTNPIRLRGKPVERYTRPPVLGEHTQEVLAEELDFSDADLAELRTAGVL